jgi:hypothetical protein
MTASTRSGGDVHDNLPHVGDARDDEVAKVALLYDAIRWRLAGAPHASGSRAEPTPSRGASSHRLIRIAGSMGARPTPSSTAR